MTSFIAHHLAACLIGALLLGLVAIVVSIGLFVRHAIREAVGRSVDW